MASLIKVRRASLGSNYNVFADGIKIASIYFVSNRWWCSLSSCPITGFSTEREAIAFVKTHHS